MRSRLRAGSVLGLAVVFSFGAPDLTGGVMSAPAPVSAGSTIAARTSSEPAPVVQRRRRRRRRRRGQQKPTPPRIREIQAALIEADYLKGEPSGVWDDGTAGAMSDFQKDNGFRVTGKPDALSLIKLGLGSETAGVGAPRKTTGQSSSDSSSDNGKNEKPDGAAATEN